MNFAEFRRSRTVRKQEVARERRNLTSQEQCLLYGLRLKTMEHITLKQVLPPSKVDEIIVEYAMRLRKAKKNFESNNHNYTLEEKE
jgi:hypothetical protein